MNPIQAIEDLGIQPVAKLIVIETLINKNNALYDTSNLVEFKVSKPISEQPTYTMVGSKSVDTTNVKIAVSLLSDQDGNKNAKLVYLSGDHILVISDKSVDNIDSCTVTSVKGFVITTNKDKVSYEKIKDIPNLLASIYWLMKASTWDSKSADYSNIKEAWFSEPDHMHRDAR